MFEIYTEDGLQILSKKEKTQCVLNYKKKLNDDYILDYNVNTYPSRVPFKFKNEALYYVPVNDSFSGDFSGNPGRTKYYYFSGLTKREYTPTTKWYSNPGGHCFDGFVFNKNSWVNVVETIEYEPTPLKRSLFQLYDKDGNQLLNINDGVRFQNLQYMVEIPPTLDSYWQLRSKSIGIFDTKMAPGWGYNENYVNYSIIRNITIKSKDGRPLYVSRLGCEGLKEGYTTSKWHDDTVGWGCRWNKDGTQLDIQVGMFSWPSDGINGTIFYWDKGHNKDPFYILVSTFPGLENLPESII